MAKRIVCGLNSSDIKKAIKELQDYKAELNKKAAQIVNSLTEFGAVIARAFIVEMDAVDKGNLVNSIGAFYDPTTNTGFVRADCDYAVFVEFGTGVRGKVSPYPGDAINQVAYRYGDGTHYVMLADGRVGWFYPADNGTMVFTEGMPSRPFMFDTAQELRSSLVNICKGVFA